MEHPTLAPPKRRLLSDFLCLAAGTHVPCQLDWVAGHGSLQRMPNQYANWAQNPSLQFPGVFKRWEIHKSVALASFGEQVTLLVMAGKPPATYLAAVCWTHRSRAFLAPPCRGGFRLMGELVVSVLLVELSREELLLDKAWIAGKPMVSSSI